VIVDRTALRDILTALPFDPGRWVVAGSAPMLMAGLVDSIADVDVVVDAVAWRQALCMVDQGPRHGLLGDHLVGFDVAGAQVEVFDGWLGTDADTIVAEAVDVEGVPCSPLERVLDSKRRLIRPKDTQHIAILEAHLGEGSAAQAPMANGQ
jgi:hypothetical protein